MTTIQTEAAPDEPGLAVEVAARHPDGLVLGPGEGGGGGGEAGALLLLLGAAHAGDHPLRLLHLLQLGQPVRQQPHVVRGAGLQVPLQLGPRQPRVAAHREEAAGHGRAGAHQLLVAAPRGRARVRQQLPALGTRVLTLTRVLVPVAAPGHVLSILRHGAGHVTPSVATSETMDLFYLKEKRQLTATVACPLLAVLT